MPDYDMWAEKVCTIYVARPTLCQGPPSEAGHTAVWAPARLALDLLDNVGDRAMLFGAMARFGL
jgi:8-oxo-dGTP diphosphatase